MKLSSGEKKWLLFSVVAIGLPLSVGLYLNGINAAPTVRIPAPPKPPKPNGYDLYVAAAGAMTVANPPVDPVNDSKLITDPKVRAKRYSLARKTAWLNANGKAFALFDQAKRTPSLSPPQRGNGAGAGFTAFAALRELARKKIIESNARWMRGDYAGALESGIDTVQMGHDMRRGGVIITELVGVAIGAIGRSVTHDTVDKLDAKQAKLAARRLEKLLQTRWTLGQTLTEDKHYSQSVWLDIFKSKDWRSADIAGVGSELSLGERIRVYTISKQRIVDDLNAVSERQIANARLPYLKQQPDLQINDNPFQSLFSVGSSFRFNDARDLAGDQLLMFRLALRAYRLENGQYPPDLRSLTPAYLKSIPADPFGGGEIWRYKPSGQSYSLYSIGPDGKDDGGQPIPWRNGASRPSSPDARVRLPSVMPDSVGDYVAGKNG